MVTMAHITIGLAPSSVIMEKVLALDDLAG